MLVSFGIAKKRHRAFQVVLSGEFADLEGEVKPNLKSQERSKRELKHPRITQIKNLTQ